MNVFGEKKRSWRKARKRGVSPIIATILLVAITVVLAAVLYVLISGLTTGPGNAPLGSHFGWGSPTNTTTKAPTVYSYSIDIASASGVSTSDVSFGLHSTNGASLPVSSYITEIWLNNTQGVNVATWTAAGGWAPIGSFNGALAGGMTLGISAAKGMLGDSFIAVGGGSFSGTVASSAFP